VVAATVESSKSHKVARSPYVYKYRLVPQVDRTSNSASSSHQAVPNRRPDLRLQNTRRLTDAYSGRAYDGGARNVVPTVMVPTMATPRLVAPTIVMPRQKLRI
jgi:hypothetical protein